MSRYDIATGKIEQIEKDLKDINYFDSDTRVLLNASKSRYITAFLRQDNSLYYAVVMGNLGEDKSTIWKMIVCDKEGYVTYKEACNNFRDTLPPEYRDIRILEH